MTAHMIRQGAFHLVRTHPGGGEGFKSLDTFPLRITCKKGEWAQIACKIAYILRANCSRLGDRLTTGLFRTLYLS